MSIIVEGAGVAVMGRAERRRDEDAATRHVEVAISELAFEALMGKEAGSAAPAAVKFESALRCYLGDKDSDRAAWPYPGFLRGSETLDGVRLELDVAADLWRAFEVEAAAQGVSIEQLSEHAAFYFGAERDAGRLTERILNDLSDSAEGEKI
ncbi:MAG TPA: hypothetical protein VFJ61_08655 [Solirubrobacterales bacterium]|nr:hypothetical protein [Solirubrobacterales bacterium]